MKVEKKLKRALILSAATASLCITFASTGFAQDGKDVDWPIVKQIWDTLTPDEQAYYQEMLDEMNANKVSPKPQAANILGNKVEAGLRVPGDTCGAATNEISTLPFSDAGVTTGNADTYQLTADCGGATAEPFTGADWAYLVEVDTDCDVTASIINDDYDSAIYVLTDCGTQTCVAGGDDPEDASFTATAGTDYFVIVDGWNGQSGNYELTITETTATGCQLVPVELQSFSVD